MTDQPPLKLRPKLDRWLRDRGLSASALAQRWSLTPQGAARYLLPFSDPRRIIPSEERIADALAWTDGEVTVADWYAPELSRPSVGEAAASEAAQ